MGDRARNAPGSLLNRDPTLIHEHPLMRKFIQTERAALAARLRALAAAEERAANAPATPGGIALHLYAESVLTEIADELERTSMIADEEER